MKRLRIEQKKNEIPDIFAMRSFVMALEYMNHNQARAASNWMAEVAYWHRRPDGKTDPARGKIDRTDSTPTTSEQERGSLSKPRDRNEALRA